ncbi:MAG TPA: hypothetical protein VIM35_05415 [Gallionella sp.]
MTAFRAYRIFKKNGNSAGRFVALANLADTAFDGHDALKTDTVLEAQSHGITFKTV